MSEDKVTIVMVEDDAGHALLIEKNLRRSGIMNKLVHLSDGRTALDYFLNDNFAIDQSERTLVLLDLNLPEVDGFEVLQHLKSNEKTKKIPVIILTTTSNPQEVDRCYELGCNIYIVKPVDYNSFSEALSKLGMMLAIVNMPNIKESH